MSRFFLITILMSVLSVLLYGKTWRIVSNQVLVCRKGNSHYQFSKSAQPCGGKPPLSLQMLGKNLFISGGPRRHSMCRRRGHTESRLRNDTPQGVYLLRVTLEGGKVFSDKVVKE